MFHGEGRGLPGKPFPGRQKKNRPRFQAGTVWNMVDVCRKSLPEERRFSALCAGNGYFLCVRHDGFQGTVRLLVADGPVFVHADEFEALSFRFGIPGPLFCVVHQVQFFSFIAFFRDGVTVFIGADGVGALFTVYRTDGPQFGYRVRARPEFDGVQYQLFPMPWFQSFRFDQSPNEPMHEENSRLPPTSAVTILNFVFFMV